MNQAGKVRWGILGTGAIAKAFANNLSASATGVAFAVGSRQMGSADQFGNELNIPRRHGSYEDLLADRDVDAVYIATPHPMHAIWAIRACDAKKHVLVEKPIAVNHPEAMAIVEAATANDVFLMEAFMYRCHPQTRRLLQLLRDERVVGDVKVIEASFGFRTAFNPGSRLFNNALGGGGILDVGCYPMSMARLIAGAEPVEVKGAAHLGQTGVDEWAAATLRFPGDVIAQIATGISVETLNVLTVFGTEGWLIVPMPWTANRSHGEPCNITVNRRGERVRNIYIEAEFTAFTYEADIAGRAILAGKRQAESPAMSWADSLGNMRALDEWRQSIGQSYEFERFENYPRITTSGRALSRRKPATMLYGKIAGIDKPISRLVMGCDNQATLPHAAVMFDDFFERGGNCFDTAHIYAGGLQERLLGQWIKLRGVRDEVVTICKGAHTPYCEPTSLSTQLRISLERLQIDCADIYLLHRDNPQIPTGEFVDVLNEHVRAGRIKIFGGSNWTPRRIDEANDYAAKHGLQGCSVLSNNFSLARMVEPPWHGCISASDDVSREWLKQRQLPLFAWSSQARGFFADGVASPQKRDDQELVRSWYSEDNFYRLDRAKEMARNRGGSAINVALAYVLSQQFLTFALIGPRTLMETRTTFASLSMPLSAEEAAWLDLRR